MQAKPHDDLALRAEATSKRVSASRLLTLVGDDNHGYCFIAAACRKMSALVEFTTIEVTGELLPTPLGLDGGSSGIE